MTKPNKKSTICDEDLRFLERLAADGGRISKQLWQLVEGGDVGDIDEDVRAFAERHCPKLAAIRPPRVRPER